MNPVQFAFQHARSGAVSSFSGKDTAPSNVLHLLQSNTEDKIHFSGSTRRLAIPILAVSQLFDDYMFALAVPDLAHGDVTFDAVNHTLAALIGTATTYLGAREMLKTKIRNSTKVELEHQEGEEQITITLGYPYKEGKQPITFLMPINDDAQVDAFLEEVNKALLSEGLEMQPNGEIRKLKNYPWKGFKWRPLGKYQRQTLTNKFKEAIKGFAHHQATSIQSGDAIPVQLTLENPPN